MKLILQPELKKDLCDIAPKWKSRIIDPNDELDEEKEIDNVILDLGDPLTCIVGEAYKFDTKSRYYYGCEICEKYSMAMYCVIDKGSVGSMYFVEETDVVKGFPEFLEAFVRHFKTEHVMEEKN